MVALCRFLKTCHIRIHLYIGLHIHLYCIIAGYTIAIFPKSISDAWVLVYLVVETAWERYARDESADGTVMLPCYVWSCWGAAAAGRETAERMCGRCCYHGMWSCWGLATVLMLFAAVGGRCCGDEAADDAVTLLFAAVGGIDVRERECGDESADDAVAMLFAAVGGGCWGARLRRRICGRCCYPAICSCWG